MDQFDTAVSIAEHAMALDSLNKKILPAHLVQQLTQLVENLHTLAGNLAGPRVDEIYRPEDSPLTPLELAIINQALKDAGKETIH
jgi:hypothetical protein